MAFARVLIVAAFVVAAGNNIVNPTTGLCLDIYAPCIGGQEENGCQRVEAKDIPQGAGMQAWRCHNEENQNFEVIGGRLRNKATGLCVDVRLPCRDGSEAEECERGALQDITQVTTLQMSPCLEGGNRGEQGSQIWDFLENGLIKHEDTGLCMDIRAHIVEGGARAEPEDVQEESPIQIYTCHSEGNQLFDFEQGDLAEQVGDEVVSGLSSEEVGTVTTSASSQAEGVAPGESDNLTTTGRPSNTTVAPGESDNLTTTGRPSNTTEASAANASSTGVVDEAAAAAATNGTTTPGIPSGHDTSTDDTTPAPPTLAPMAPPPATTTTAVNESGANQSASGDTTTTPRGSTSEINTNATVGANETGSAVVNDTSMNRTPGQDYFWYAGEGNVTGSNATNITNDTTNDTLGEGVDSDEFFELVGPNLRKPQGLLPVRVALGAAGASALAAGLLIMARIRRGGVEAPQMCLEAQGMMSFVE